LHCTDTEIYQKKLQVRIYLILLIPFCVILLLSSCKRSGVSNTSNRKNYQNNASGGSSKYRQKQSPEEKSTPKEKSTKTAGAASDKAKKIIKTARSYTGTPYKYGGTSKAGVDCSGLTSLCFKSVDITLPRTSLSQSTVGAAVELNNILPGDLVFFSDNKKSKKITHVGIVTEVNGNSAKFIHASTQLGVVENELLSGYYYPLIVKVRRVL
jgi:probable lipoprotein NlpC